MWLLYALWRFRGIDPFAYMHGEDLAPSARYESMLAGFSVYAARTEEAMMRGIGG